jgi:outer membrane protein TolC
MGDKMFIRKTILLLLLLLAFINNPNFVHAQEIDTLHVFIQRALDNNPEIKQAYHSWKAAEYKINHVKGLPDPNLNYGYLGENIETRVGPQEQKFGVSQKVPFPGKLKTRGEVQEKEAQILKQKYEATKNEIIKDVKFAYYDLYWIDRALEINEEEKAILEDIEKVAQRKYESKLSSQQNVIKLQVELSKIIKKLSLVRQNRKSVVARINRLLNRKIDMSIDPIVQIEIEDFSYDLEDIIAKSKESRQELLAASLAVEKSEFEKSLAKMEHLPDFTFGYEYIEIGGGHTSSIDDGKDAWMGKISVNIPIWFGKIQSEIKAKEEELKAAKEKQEDIENSVSYEVQDLYFKITTYREIVTLYETALMPQSQQAFESSQTGFETGSVSFIDWLDTQRTYLQTRLAYHKAVSDYQKTIAFLERVIGVKLGGHHEQ